MTGSFGEDIDIEVRAEKEEGFLTLFDQAIAELAQDLGGELEVLHFEVRRLTLEDCELEFAPARSERYREEFEFYSHADVEVQVAPCLNDQEAFLRRDFSINAIALALGESDSDELVLIDPFSGEEDIKQRLLRPVHPDFEKDPIRFFRTLRFKERFNFTLTEELKGLMEHFDLRGATFMGLFKEAMKGSGSAFLAATFKQCLDSKLKLSTALQRWSFLAELQSRQKITEPKDLLTLIALEETVRQKFFDGQEELRLQDLKLKHKELKRFMNALALIGRNNRDWSFFNEAHDFKSLALNPKAMEYLNFLRWLKTEEGLQARLERLGYLELTRGLKSRYKELEAIEALSFSEEELQGVEPRYRSYMPLYTWLKKRKPTA